MAYGIGSILGDIDQKADAYRNNPDALAQAYQQNQQLIDLLVLQKLKTDKEAAQRDMQAKMQTPASTIKDQRAQEVMGMTRNEVAQQVTPGLQALGQQMQAAQAQPQAQGISSVPAPNMQQIGMKGGGIVAFAEAGPVEGAVSTVEKTSPVGRMFQSFLDNLPRYSDPEGGMDAAIREYEQNAPVLSAEDQAKLDTIDAQTTRLRDNTGLVGLLRPQSDAQLAANEAELKRLVTQATRIIKNTRTPAEDAANLAMLEGGGGERTPEEDAANLAMLEGGGGTENQNQNQNQNQNAKFTSNITDVDNERNIASMLGEDLSASKAPENTNKPTTEAILKVPTEVVQRAPSEAQQSYAKQLADLRVEQESKLESLIAFLKGAGGQSSFAATMMGGSDAMNAREAQVKGEIMDVLGKLEAIDLKEQEFDIEGRKIGTAETANEINRERLNLENAQYYANLESEEAQNRANNTAKMQEILAQRETDFAKIAIQEGLDFDQMNEQERLKFVAQTVESVKIDDQEYINNIAALRQQLNDGKITEIKYTTDAKAALDMAVTRSANAFNTGFNVINGMGGGTGAALFGGSNAINIDDDE